MLKLILRECFLTATQWNNPATGCSSTWRLKTSDKNILKICPVLTMYCTDVQVSYCGTLLCSGVRMLRFSTPTFRKKKYLRLQSIFTAVLYFIYWPRIKTIINTTLLRQMERQINCTKAYKIMWQDFPPRDGRTNYQHLFPCTFS